MKNYIFFLFFLIGVTGARSEYVTFDGKNVTVSCGKNGVLHYKSPSDPKLYTTDNNDHLKEQYEENQPDKYYCMISEKKIALFIKAKVCDNCIEFDGSYVVCIICGDLLITGCIILTVYLYGQRKSGPAPQKPTNARRTAGGGPPVPSPDYQPLSDFNRSKDTYATVHKTG